MAWRYEMDEDKYARLTAFELKADFSAVRKQKLFVQWTLYADNMAPKTRSVPFGQFHEF